MPEYVVIADFNDRVEGVRRESGEVINVDIDRAKRLAESGVIEFVENTAPDETGLTSLGGGYYKLPNGEKVRGREKALEALGQLKVGETDGNQGNHTAE